MDDFLIQFMDTQMVSYYKENIKPQSNKKMMWVSYHSYIKISVHFMSIITKVRTVLYIFRIFYWIAFKAVVRGYLNGSVHLYEIPDSGHSTSGRDNWLSFSERKYSNVKDQNQEEKTKL